MSFLSIRPFSVDGVVEEPCDIPEEVELPVVAPFGGAVVLFMPDFEVSFEEEDGLVLGTLFELPGWFACANAAPDIVIRQVAAIRSFFITFSFDNSHNANGSAMWSFLERSDKREDCFETTANIARQHPSSF